MFWDRFYNLCEKNGTKPNPVGTKIGISSGIITKWKTGTMPNGESLIKIADYFNVSIDYLLGKTDDPTPPNKKDPPLLTAEDALRLLADENDLTAENIKYLKQTIWLLHQTNKAKQFKEKLKEETSDELSPESN